MHAITSTRSRKLRIQSKDFRRDDDLSTQANSESGEGETIMETQLAGATRYRFRAGCAPFLDTENSSVHANEEDSQRFPSVHRKRANSNLAHLRDSLYPNTPNKADYQQKYKTEICKNFQYKGFCKWGDMVGSLVFFRAR